MYKIDRRGGGTGGVKKSYTRNIPTQDLKLEFKSDEIVDVGR